MPGPPAGNRRHASYSCFRLCPGPPAGSQLAHLDQPYGDYSRRFSPGNSSRKFVREFPRCIFSANPSRIILRADFARESLGRFIGADIPENSSRELRARMFRREGSPHDLEDSARVFHARIFQGGQPRADRPEGSRVSFARDFAGRINCASSEGPARSKRAPGPCEGAAGTPPSNPTPSRSLMILTSKLSPAVASTCCCGGDAQPRCWSLGRNLVGWGGDHQPAVRPGA